MSSNIGIIAILHSANLNPRPTWGATNLFLGVQRPDAFQPALPRRERRLITRMGRGNWTFQPTLPQEERQ